jgi:hypothetical protein
MNKQLFCLPFFQEEKQKTICINPINPSPATQLFPMTMGSLESDQTTVRNKEKDQTSKIFEEQQEKLGERKAFYPRQNDENWNHLPRTLSQNTTG